MSQARKTLESTTPRRRHEVESRVWAGRLLAVAIAAVAVVVVNGQRAAKDPLLAFTFK